MDILSDMQETPSQLEDALARLGQAKEDYFSLVHELNEFLFNYVRGMVKGFDRKTGHFVIKLRHPNESNVRGSPVVLVTQIVESLRTSLDYMVFELSVLNTPDLNQRVPQFVIADSESDFNRQAKTRLRYLTAEQKSVVEQIQPYNGNGMLGLLGEMAIQGKHRRLLSLQNVTGLDIYFADIAKQGDYEDCFVYPAAKGSAIFARPKNTATFLLIEKYDAMGLLKDMIGCVEDILQVSYCFFQGRPLEVKILKG